MWIRLALRKDWLAFNVILLIIGCLLVNRYINIGFSPNEVVWFSIYYAFGILLLLTSRLFFENFINPISLFTLFIFQLGYSFIQFSDSQQPLSFVSLFIINTSILFFLLGTVLPLNLPKTTLNLTIRSRVIVYFFLTFMGLITILLESVFLIGYLPVANLFAKDVYRDTLDNYIPLLHYFVSLSCFVPVWGYILFKNNHISKFWFVISLLTSFFVLSNVYGRQIYLLTFLSLFIAYTYYNRVNTSRILIIIICFFSLFYFIGQFRNKWADTYGNVIKMVTGISNEKVTAVEAIFVEFSAKRYTAFEKMVNRQLQTNYYGYGIYWSQPLSSLFLLQKLGMVKILPEFDSFSEVATYAIDPYLDYGIPGIIIFNLLYGILARRYYMQFTEKDSSAIVKWGIFSFCIIMMMYVNFINTAFIWLGLIFNKIIISPEYSHSIMHKHQTEY